MSLKQGSKISGAVHGPLGGTALYMAPECMLTYSTCTQYSDMWSLGITFLELYTNTMPWSIKNCKQLCQLMAQETPPHALSQIDPAYSELIMACVNYTPTARKSATDVVQLLKSLENTDLEKHYGYQW